MDKLELKALGKLNLGLDILGQMENGYHEVRMVMQTVYLYDRVLLEKTEGDEIQIQSNLAYLPNNENNIAYKAAAILKEEFHIKGGIRITLEKHIPVAAGMAGGSADAAAVLFGMNRMFHLRLSEEALKERGVKLGADVRHAPAHHIWHILFLWTQTAVALRSGYSISDMAEVVSAPLRSPLPAHFHA